MKLFTVIAALATSLFATVASAVPEACGVAAPCEVPEIDALAGFAALAVVGAAVALIRERNKR